MKILLLNDDFPPFVLGGAGVVAYRLARQYQRMGHEVAVVSSVQDKTRAGFQVIDGIPVYFLYSNYPERFRAYFSLYNPHIFSPFKKILQSISPDVVHAHNIHTHLSYHCLKIACDRGIPVVLTCHDVMSFAYNKLYHFIDPNDFSLPQKFDYRVSQWFLLKENRLRYFPFRNGIVRRYLKKNVCRIVSVSNALKEALEANGITNVETIHNGIDPDEMVVDGSVVKEFAERYGLTGKKVVFFGGRLSYLKGSEHLLKAMQRVAAEVPDALLLVAGSGEKHNAHLYKTARNYGIESNVITIGWIAGGDLKSAYALSSVVVVPSVCFDSFPTANLEAMAAGKPVVATCFGGSREIVKDGETGYIVNPLHFVDMAEKMVILLKDAALSQRMGEAARRRVEKMFSIERCAQHYLSVFKTVQSTTN